MISCYLIRILEIHSPDFCNCRTNLQFQIEKFELNNYEATIELIKSIKIDKSFPLHKISNFSQGIQRETKMKWN